MKTFPKPLSTKEETEHLLACKNGDLHAREVLIERNLRLVAHIVKKYNTTNYETEDLISIGTIGLIKAIDTFRMEKGIRLATYASCCIEHELLMLFRSEKKSMRNIYMMEPIGADSEGNEICLQDLLESDQVDILERMELQGDVKRLYAYMDRVLTRRERQILIMRYGLYRQEEKTQREIAQQMHISRSYVSRIEKRALGKLRDCFGKRE